MIKIALDEYRKYSNDYENGILDILENFNPEKFKSEKKFNLILFTDVLEHVINPGVAVANLKKISEAYNNATICITVPNAYSVVYFKEALFGYECIHPDDYYYFSPYTLKKLALDSGFKNVRFKFLYTPGAKDIPDNQRRDNSYL